MDLRGIVNGATRAVNPNIIVTVKRSTGSTVGAGYRQVPSYAAPVSGPAQIQALKYSELKQLDGLNIQGVVKAIYLRGELAGVVRPTGVGGDIVTFGEQDWLVVTIFENWPTWTKAGIQLQGGV